MVGVAQEQSSNAGPDSQGLSLVVAMARNGTIGIEDRLPWKLRSDLMRFKRLTMGHSLLMGRKTYESIGRLLPGRKTIILTRQRDYRIEGAAVVHSLEQAFEETPAGQRLYVVGGAEIYRLCMPWVKQIHLTRVLADIPGDTVLDELDLRDFSMLESEFVPSDSSNDWPSQYELYERRKNID
ncbi:MAG: dihydrofolate reductase [Planctomycetota bacterium]